MLVDGIQDATGMPKLAGKGRKDLVMGKESTKVSYNSFLVCIEFHLIYVFSLRMTTPLQIGVEKQRPMRWR